MHQVRNTQAGVAGGTLSGILSLAAPEELLKTLVMAALGAATSFAVSFFLQWLTQRKKKIH